MTSRQVCSAAAALIITVFLACSFSSPASADCTPAKYGTPGCPYPGFGNDDTYRPNTDRPGSDYTSFNLKGNYPSDCRDACLKDTRCLAWTFVKPGVQGPTARCWLKSAVPGEQANNCCVSGRNPTPAYKPVTKLKVKPSGTGSGGGGGLSADATALLNAHNGYRAKHCVPALAWSAQLAASAQTWANACTKNGSSFAHSPGAWKSANGYGENLAWGGSLSAKGAVDLWYAEINSYNFNAPSWNGSVGHFTQVVWRGSTQVGCAVATCGGQRLWVCQYSPTGNWNTNQAGVLANNVPPACK